VASRAAAKAYFPRDLLPPLLQVGRSDWLHTAIFILEVAYGLSGILYSVGLKSACVGHSATTRENIPEWLLWEFFPVCIFG
jgi:hypothetical protein